MFQRGSYAYLQDADPFAARAESSSAGRRRGPPKACLEIEDRPPPQPCEPSPVLPAAGADPLAEFFKEDPVASTIFEGYDANAEEAAELLENGGRLRSILSAKQAQKMGAFLLSKAKERAFLTAFTFDLLIICAALKEAAQRGIRVQVFVDKGHSLRGTTASQMDRLDDLRNNGIEVYLTTGIAGGGIQHSKTLLVDNFIIVGSTNWTSSSRSNHELSVLLELDETGKTAALLKGEYILQSSTLLTIKGIEDSRLTRESRQHARAKSAEPDRFATARRFSIANERRNREAQILDLRERKLM